MGQDQSSPGGLTIDIPPSLRAVYPFLYDAQRNFSNATKPMQTGGGSSAGRKRIAVTCINHAISLIYVLNLDLDADGKACLDKFRHVRNQLSLELGIPHDPRAEQEMIAHSQKRQYQSHDLLIAEADAALALAEDQLQEGFRFEAMLNYHTACVYFRVMESMLPNIAPQVHPRLMYAAWRTRQCSQLEENFVNEHFGGESCAETYDVHSSNRLGKGSYGSVYLATHRITGDERAVKVMNVDRVTSYYLRKLHLEISILKTLDHPNIIKLQDVFFGKRSVYLVTDLCRGGELFEMLNNGKSHGFVFREDRVNRLMRDMLSAVHYLHSKGIVHRDLKLENFLFDDKSLNSPLLLIDFGLSKHFEPEERLTQRVGSCYYTAPEVLQGKYDYRCDIWSLGVLCYMMLSGSPPFYGKTVDDVYAATLSQEAVFPDKKFKHVSGVCMDFMKRLLVKDPHQRMSTAEALAHPFITGGLAAPPAFPSMPGSLPPSASARGASGPLPSVVAESIIQSMLRFAGADPLTKLVLEMVGHSLCPDHTRALCDEFQAIDRANNGALSLQAFSSGLISAPSVSNGLVDISMVFNAIAISRAHGHGQLLTFTSTSQRPWCTASTLRRSASCWSLIALTLVSHLCCLSIWVSLTHPPLPLPLLSQNILGLSRSKACKRVWVKILAL